MTENRTESDALERSDAQHQKRFTIANLLIMLVFITGNVLLPRFFFAAHDGLTFTIATFLSGVWATQAATMGIYAALTDQFILVRFSWATIGLAACVLSILGGLQIASFVNGMPMFTTYAALIGGMGFAGAFLLYLVGVGMRVCLGVRLTAAAETRQTGRPNFGIAFLFRLTTAIALLMLALQFTRIRLDSTASGIPWVQFVQIILVTFVFVSALIAAILQASLAVAGRRIGFFIVSSILCLGMPLDVAISRHLLPNSFHFWYQLFLFLAFFSGFAVSLFIVCEIWRRTGLRLARQSQPDA